MSQSSNEESIFLSDEIGPERSTQGNQRVWNYFLSLLDDPLFKEQITAIRTHNNLALNPKHKEYLKLDRAITNLCRFWGLDEIMWKEQIMHFIRTDEVPKEYIGSSCIVFDRLEMGEDGFPNGYYEDDSDIPREPVELEPWSYAYPVIIRVSPYASQREIIDFVKKTYAKLIKPIQEMYKDEDVQLGKVRKRNSRVQERNRFIIKNAHLPRKELVRLVFDKFGEVLEYSYISKIIAQARRKDLK